MYQSVKKDSLPVYILLKIFSGRCGSICKALSSAEAPAGYHSKNSNNRKIESARGTMGRGKRREPLPYDASRWRRISEEDWN